jgi:hypothetical protein
MNEDSARSVVDGLRERGIDAHLAEENVYEFGIRVVLGDGREAVWGADGTAGLGAEVLLDGDLVGFVPEISGSATFDDGQILDAISRADYAQPEGRELPAAPAAGPPLPVDGGVFRRFLGGFRGKD